MLKDSPALSSFSMNSPDEMYWFYTTILGLEAERNNPSQGMMTLKLAHGGTIFIYSKPDHVPANFTVIHFQVNDIDAVVDELTRRKVKFEHFDPRADKKGIVRGFDASGPDIAWFKDPSGNILAVIQHR